MSSSSARRKSLTQIAGSFVMTGLFIGPFGPVVPDLLDERWDRNETPEISIAGTNLDVRSDAVIDSPPEVDFGAARLERRINPGVGRSKADPLVHDPATASADVDELGDAMMRLLEVFIRFGSLVDLPLR